MRAKHLVAFFGHTQDGKRCVGVDPCWFATSLSDRQQAGEGGTTTGLRLPVCAQVARFSPPFAIRMLAARLLLLVAGVRSLQHTFKGFGTNYVKLSGLGTPQTSAAPPVVLVHGFGGSSGQWRATLTDLAAAGRTVYAVDLLGFGDSPKPRLAAADAYSIELWADQLQHFVDEVVVAEDGADKATLGR